MLQDHHSQPFVLQVHIVHKEVQQALHVLPTTTVLKDLQCTYLVQQVIVVVQLCQFLQYVVQALIAQLKYHLQPTVLQAHFRVW